MGVRPRLKPGCRRVHRPDGTVQLGPDPGTGILLAGLTEQETALVELIDGTFDEAQLLAEGGRRGIPDERVRAILDLLAAHGLTIAAPTDRWDLAAARTPQADVTADAVALAWLQTGGGDGYAAFAARRERRVALLGRGSVTNHVAGLLLRAGVGRVEHGAYAAEAVEWPTMDVGGGRVHRPLRGAGTSAGPSAGGPPPAWPDLVVMVTDDHVDPEAARSWLTRGVAHLPVTVGATAATVGPVVLAGRTPCLDCLERTRDVLDPGRSLAHSRGPQTLLGPGPAVRAETSLAAVTGGLAAMVALGVLDGRPGPEGVSLHLELPWPAVRQHRWEVQPGCSCRRTPRRGEAISSSTRRRGTMDA